MEKKAKRGCFSLKRLVIFDLDGTLIHSLPDIVSSCNHALKAGGFPVHSYGEYLTFIGDGSYKLVERALPQRHREEETIQKVLALYSEHYRHHFDVETRPFSGVVEMLEALIDRDVLLAVLSNKGDSFTKEMVEELFPATFEMALGQREGIPQKPAPQGVEEILRELQIPKEDCCFIGDSDVDILTAKNAGIPAIGVTWGYRPAKELEEAGATLLCASPKKLVEAIARL